MWYEFKLFFNSLGKPFWFCVGGLVMKIAVYMDGFM